MLFSSIHDQLRLESEWSACDAGATCFFQLSGRVDPQSFSELSPKGDVVSMLHHDLLRLFYVGLMLS